MELLLKSILNVLIKIFLVNIEEINREIATYIFHHSKKQLKVDVHHPDILVTSEIRYDDNYVMDNIIKGAGGYPVGVVGEKLY